MQYFYRVERGTPIPVHIKIKILQEAIDDDRASLLKLSNSSFYADAKSILLARITANEEEIKRLKRCE